MSFADILSIITHPSSQPFMILMFFAYATLKGWIHIERAAQEQQQRLPGCPRCGRSPEMGARYCDGCGAAIGATIRL